MKARLAGVEFARLRGRVGEQNPQLCETVYRHRSHDAESIGTLVVGYYRRLVAAVE